MPGSTERYRAPARRRSGSPHRKVLQAQASAPCATLRIRNPAERWLGCVPQVIHRKHQSCGGASRQFVSAELDPQAPAMDFCTDRIWAAARRFRARRTRSQGFRAPDLQPQWESLTFGQSRFRISPDQPCGSGAPVTRPASDDTASTRSMPLPSRRMPSRASSRFTCTGKLETLGLGGSTVNGISWATPSACVSNRR